MLVTEEDYKLKEGKTVENVQSNYNSNLAKLTGFKVPLEGITPLKHTRHFLKN